MNVQQWIDLNYNPQTCYHIDRNAQMSCKALPMKNQHLCEEHYAEAISRGFWIFFFEAKEL